MTPEEKKIQEEIIKRLQFGAAEILYIQVLNAYIEFHLN